jgi:hypothetical protein
MMLATAMPVFASLAVAMVVNQETTVKQESMAAQEIMVKESVPVQVVEMVVEEVHHKEGVVEMPALMPDE